MRSLFACGLLAVAVMVACVSADHQNSAQDEHGVLDSLLAGFEQSESVAEKGLTGTTTLSVDQILSSYNHYSSPNTRKTTGASLAYVTPWNSMGGMVAKHFQGKFTHVSPVWFDVKVEIHKKRVDIWVEGHHNVDQSWIDAVRGEEKNVRVVPRFLVNLRYDDLEIIFRREALIKHLASVIVGTVREYGFDGAVVEMTEAWRFYAISDRDKHARKMRRHLNGFVRTISRRMHTVDANVGGECQLILVVRAPQRNTPYFHGRDFEETWEEVDYFSVMTYDYSSGSRTPGPGSPLKWAERAAKDITGTKLHEPGARAKVLAGIPLYGIRWHGKDTPVPVTGVDVVSLVRATRIEDGSVSLTWEEKYDEHKWTFKNAQGHVTDVVYYPTPQSVDERVRTYEDIGVGVAVWEVGQGMNYLYDVM